MEYPINYRYHFIYLAGENFGDTLYSFFIDHCYLDLLCQFCKTTIRCFTSSYNPCLSYFFVCFLKVFEASKRNKVS